MRIVTGSSTRAFNPLPPRLPSHPLSTCSLVRCRVHVSGLRQRQCPPHRGPRERFLQEGHLQQAAQELSTDSCSEVRPLTPSKTQIFKHSTEVRRPSQGRHSQVPSSLDDFFCPGLVTLRFARIGEFHSIEHVRGANRRRDVHPSLPFA